MWFGIEQDLIVEPEPEPQVKEEIFSSYLPIARFLRSASALRHADPFSSNNAHMAAYIYGSNIHDHLDYIDHVADHLLLDRAIDWKPYNERRQLTYIRSSFIDRSGTFSDPEEVFKRFRKEAIRLVEGFELRNKHPGLGLHTYQNSLIARNVIRDIDLFCKEIYHEYRERFGSADPDTFGERR